MDRKLVYTIIIVILILILVYLLCNKKKEYLAQCSGPKNYFGCFSRGITRVSQGESDCHWDHNNQVCQNQGNFTSNVDAATIN